MRLRIRVALSSFFYLLVVVILSRNAMADAPVDQEEGISFSTDCVSLADSERVGELLDLVRKRQNLSDKKIEESEAIFERVGLLLTELDEVFRKPEAHFDWLAHPYLFGPETTFPLADYSGANDAADLLSLRAAISMQREDVSSAVDDLACLGRLARLDGAAPLPSVLAAQKIRLMAYVLAARLSDSIDDEAQARLVLDLALEFGETRQPIDWEASQAGEFVYAMLWSENAGHDPLPEGSTERELLIGLYGRALDVGRATVDWEVEGAMLSERRLVDRVRREKRVAFLEKEIERLKGVSDEDFWGEKALRAPAILGQVAYCERWTRATLGLLQLQTAIQMHRMVSGDFPEDLEILVPGILSELPDDPFCSDGYFYDAKKGKPYSAGSDGRDDRRKKRRKLSTGPKEKGDIWLGSR